MNKRRLITLILTVVFNGLIAYYSTVWILLLAWGFGISLTLWVTAQG